MVYHRSVRLSYHTKSKPGKGFSAMSDNILQLNEAAIKGELKDLVKIVLKRLSMLFWIMKPMNLSMQNNT